MLLACAGQEERASEHRETPANSGPLASATPAPPVAPESTALATTGATLSGKVTFEGEPPPRKEVNMDADPFCRQAQPGPAYVQSVELNSNGTIKNAFVYIKEGVTGSYAVPTKAVILNQRGCQFSPHVFGVQVGQLLTIVNSDETYHNIHALPRNNPEFNIGQPSAGFHTTKQFTVAEVPIRLTCDLHPWMVSYAGVLPHPYSSVTNDEGNFEIKGVLPGNYVIAAWQEKYGLRTQRVTVSGEETKTVTFAFSRGQP